MRPTELAKMFDLEDTYWWFVGRRELVRELLLRHQDRKARGERRKAKSQRREVTVKGQTTLLDVGCGTGATLQAVSDLGLAVGMDRSSDALRFCRQRGLRELALADAVSLPVASESVEVVLALDLLEHIPDDAAACREFARALKPGGLLVVTVPACPWLWSEHDDALDHLRRYRGKRLREVLQGAGLAIERLSPVITSLLLPIAGLRLLQRLRPREKGTAETAFIIPPRWLNATLIALLRIERVWLRWWNLPIGVSLFAVARKRASQ